MFGVGWTELLVIGALALMLLGEEKFPDFVRIAFRAVRDFRRYWDEIKTEVEREVRKPLERELKPLQREIQNLTRIDPETYIRSITPSTPPDNKAAGPEGAYATSPDMGTPPETLDNSAAAASAAPAPATAPDEPAGNVHPDDAKVMQQGVTPYVAGGPGARAETAVEAAPAGPAESPAPEARKEPELPTPPSRID